MKDYLIPDISNTKYNIKDIKKIQPPHLKDNITIRGIDIKKLHHVFLTNKKQKEIIPHWEKNELINSVIYFMKYWWYLRGKESDLENYTELKTIIGNKLSYKRDPLDLERWLERSPIHIVLPAFANKSFNPLKTIRTTPDLWEIWSLLQLNTLCTDFSEVYGWSVYMTIIMDGTVYAPLFNEPMDKVIDYKNKFMQLSKNMQCKNINIIDMKDMLEWNIGFYKTYEDNLKDIENNRNDNIRSDVSLQNLFYNTAQNINTSMYKTEELINALVLQDKDTPERKTIYEQAKYSTQRYRAFVSTLYEQKIIYNAFPDAIRATCHPKPGQRGINLIDKESYNYPYNGVPFWTWKKIKIINQVDVDSNSAIVPIYI